MENIRYGRLDANDEEVIEAARAVGAHEFISRLENGYQTDLREGGAILSTGQRQLIAFARALLADPRILILDEATSSIDTQTEKLIQEALRRLLKGRTSFVIAHRLSTITSADLIVVIDHGRIVEQGTHEQLLAQAGMYRDLYTMAYARPLDG
jgi:ABC-type multidrug transport system fused ATPase/permease subunit